MTGDGIMALFGAPVALEDAPQRAIRSSLAIHREMANFEFDTGIQRIKNKQLHLVVNENKNQQIKCSTLVISVACSRSVSGLVALTNDCFNISRGFGDCLNPRNIYEIIWGAYEFMRRL